MSAADLAVLIELEATNPGVLAWSTERHAVKQEESK